VEGSPEPAPQLQPEMFRWRPDVDARQPVRPSRLRALEALPERGSVLDVGVGAGASSFGLAGKAGLIVGVDRQPDMLRLFEETARTLGVAVRPIVGTWPEAASDVEPADVAICHHAIYFVQEIEDFVLALTARARRRVVIELSARPPLTRLNPLWESFHGVSRRDWRVADALQAVLEAMGLGVEREDTVLPARAREVTPEFVAFVRRRLYVGPERDREIDQFLRGLEPQPETIAALWWPGAA
jgi:precorrin-6B methylase 2